MEISHPCAAQVPRDHRGACRFRGGWAEVSGGSYWWRECRATIKALLECRLDADPDFPLRRDYERVVESDRGCWVRVRDPFVGLDRPLKVVHAKGAVARRGRDFESRALWELPPGVRSSGDCRTPEGALLASSSWEK